MAAKDLVRRWVRDGTDIVLDRFGEEAIRAAADATTHLTGLAEGRSAQAIIADVERLAATWGDPPPPARFRWLRGRPPSATGASTEQIDALVLRLDAERDESTRQMILLTSTRDRLAKAAGGLERALATLGPLRPMIESAARELRREQPERAAAMQDRGAAILLEREQALLTQRAIHQQAMMTLDLLIANQTVLDKAIVQARTATLSALQVAMAARQVVGEQTRIDPGPAVERAREKLQAALEEARQAMDAMARAENSPGPLDL